MFQVLNQESVTPWVPWDIMDVLLCSDQVLLSGQGSWYLTSHQQTRAVDWPGTELAECLPSIQDTLGSFPFPKLVMVTHSCKPSTWEVDTGGVQVQGHLRLHSEFDGSLGHMGPGP